MGGACRRHHLVEILQGDVAINGHGLRQAERTYAAHRMAGQRQHILGPEHADFAAKHRFGLFVIEPRIPARHHQKGLLPDAQTQGLGNLRR